MRITARDIMTPDVVSVPEDMDLKDLAKMFLREGFTGAPVVDRAGELVGVISQTDLVYYQLTRGDELVDAGHFYDSARVEGHHLPGGFQIEDANTARVSDLMTPVVHAVTERAAVDSVIRLMTDKHIHRVIVRRGAKPVGIISALDVLRSLVNPSQAETTRSPKAAAGAKKKVARSKGVSKTRPKR